MQPYCLARNRTALVTTIHNAAQYNLTLPSEENNKIKVIVRNDWGMALTSLARSHANQILHITVIKPSKIYPPPLFTTPPLFPRGKKIGLFSLNHIKRHVYQIAHHSVITALCTQKVKRNPFLSVSPHPLKKIKKISRTHNLR